MIDIVDKLDMQLLIEAKRLIESRHNIVILTHISPDGDAMGSSLGLLHWLKQYKNDNSLINLIVPNAYPLFLQWMPGTDDVQIYENHIDTVNRLIRNADLIFYNDLNDPKRLGTLGEISLDNPCEKIFIDHHLNPITGDFILFSHPEASSTCELVYRFIYQMSKLSLMACPLPLEAAICLYTGLMTDTGNFSYNSNQPELYMIISDLVRHGVNKDDIYDKVNNQHSLSRMRLIGYCLYKKMRLYAKNKIALICLNKAELYKFNFQSGDGEGLVNLPLKIKNVRYSCFMREDNIGIYDLPPSPDCTTKVKISFRSRGNFPVNVMAKEIFSGGGHLNAAGGEFYGSISDATDLFLKNMNKYLI